MDQHQFDTNFDPIMSNNTNSASKITNDVSLSLEIFYDVFMSLVSSHQPTLVVGLDMTHNLNIQILEVSPNGLLPEVMFTLSHYKVPHTYLNY